MSEIIKINPTEYGIEENKATELIGNLPQIQKEREILEAKFNDVIKMDIEQPETITEARELRLLIQKNRTKGINVWHKTTKDFFLKGGQFVDAIKRKEIAVNERMEADLEVIEKHAEIKEKKRLQDLQIKRVGMLSKFVEDAGERDLSSMECDVWEAYLQTKKKEYEDKIAAEKKAEADRVAREKAEAEERERIRKENEKLKKEVEERERLAEIEAEKHEAERRKNLEAAEKAQAEFQATLKAEREAKEKIEREARHKREKLEAEIKAKEDAERKAKEQEAERLQNELNKGDVAKVEDLITDLERLKKAYSFKSAKNKKMYSNVGLLIDKIITHIEIN